MRLVGYTVPRADRWHRRSRIVAGLVAGTVALAGLAVAQDYPAKPVKIVVPYSAGGVSDTITRIVANKLTNRLGQSFLIENRPGAAGAIGSEVVARSATDGYTLLVSGIGSHVIAPVMSTVPWDPMKSFTHIALFGGSATVLVVNPDVPASTVREFIAYAKSRPEGIAYGSPGRGTHGHLIGEIFREQTGVKLVHVPYKGGGPAMGDLVAGHVPAVFVTLGGASANVRAGKARPLAITAEKRLPDYPELATFAESGYRELSATTWFGLSGPAGIPRNIVNRLNAEVRAILVLPDVREKLHAEGMEPNDLDADAFTAFIKLEIERWTRLAKAAK